MTCQLIVNQLTVGHSWPKVFVNDFSTLMGGGVNVLSQMQGLCMVQLDLLPPPPTGNSQDKFSPLGLGVGNCLKKSCPRGMRVGQIKNNFLLFCKLCVISCAVCTKLQNSRPRIFKGKR